ncbi:MAG: two pore domain potassium channel family protein [Betaproteobacteria bacterium]|nr:two pore domain potassium channel family protein [Betaproteobacteria bacterium]
MAIVAACCILLLILTTVVHYEVLRLVSFSLPLVRIPPRAKPLVVVFSAFAAHAVEILLYGAAFYGLARLLDLGTLAGATLSFESCLYFSAETFTSLGFGDLVPRGSLRLLAGVETLNGLLLIGWSASFLYIAMERFWDEARKASS